MCSTRHAKGRPHGHRHGQRRSATRCASTCRGVPARDDEEGAFPSVAYELLWFLRGDSNVRWLQEHGVTIWDEWADADGELGPVYGVQWRSWPTPGRRPRRSDRRGRPTPPRGPRLSSNRRQRVERRGHPAHGARTVPRLLPVPRRRGGRLSCQIYQRSADVFLGVPFNIASYALLTHMLAQQSDLALGDLVWTGGDCHIYDNHREQVETLLSRDPYPYPSLRLRRRPESIFEVRVRGLRRGRLPAPSGDPRAGCRVTVALSPPSRTTA